MLSVKICYISLTQDNWIFDNMKHNNEFNENLNALSLFVGAVILLILSLIFLFKTP